MINSKYQDEVNSIRRSLPNGNWDWPGADSVCARLQAIAHRLAFNGILSSLHIKTMAVLGCGHEETCKGHLLYLAHRGYTVDSDKALSDMYCLVRGAN